VGYVLGGWKRAKLSTLGGFIGGLGGGLVFDAVAWVSHGGSASRFVGFILIGLLTGAAVALVDDLTKQNWVTVLSGPKEGRSFILTKPITTIGRSEMADIPLFADPNVVKEHARLLLQGPDVMVQSASNTTVTVNGAQTQYAQLRPWDVIGVGRWSLRFHQKASRQHMAYIVQPLPDLTSPQYKPTYSPVNRTVSQPAAAVATGQLALVATSGPHLNQRFGFGPGTVRIGRETGCGILLAQDTVVSRNHAEVAWNGTSWVIRDLQSRNGLWMNGVRVTEHVLSVGDQIGVGQSWLRVEQL
jgi:pSer/pThr/pTyr-binding forkhead associated (FHA) protein